MSEFDKDIVVGDIIRAYHKGFHRVTRIERRYCNHNIPCHRSEYMSSVPTDQHVEMNSLIYYKVIMHDTFRPAKGGIKCCDSSYCKKYTPELLEEERLSELKRIDDGYAALKLLMK